MNKPIDRTPTLEESLTLLKQKDEKEGKEKR
jgi:hypothetical protein